MVGDGVAMDPAGLAAKWESSEEIRNQIRDDGRLLVPSKKNDAWCEPSSQNAVKNTAVLLPALELLRNSNGQKLPYLEPLQNEIVVFMQKMGRTPTDKVVYRHAGELKKLLSFIKRRANHEEVTKDVRFHVLLLAFKPELKEFIDDYMAKGKPNHETNGEEPDPEDMGINEDAQTQQDFEQFKAWLQETFGPAASVKRAASSSSLSDGESSVASSSKDGNPECVHPKPAITRRTPIEIATNNSGADSVNLCGSCGKTSCKCQEIALLKKRIAAKKQHIFNEPQIAKPAPAPTERALLAAPSGRAVNPDLADTLPMDVDTEFWQESQPRDFDMEIQFPDPEPEVESMPALGAAALLPEDPLVRGGDVASCEVSAGADVETTPDAVATALEPPGQLGKRKSQVLTRREQLAKEVPDPDGEIAAAKAKAKAKAKARAKAKAKAKGMAKSPKVKPSPARKRAVKAKAKAAAASEVEPEVQTPAFNPNYEMVQAERAEVPDIDTPKRNLFGDAQKPKGKGNGKKEKAPRAPRAKAGKGKGSAKGSANGSGGSNAAPASPAAPAPPAGVDASGRGRGRGRGKGRGKGSFLGVENAALACPEMENMILEQLRVTLGKPFDDVKNYLNSKNDMVKAKGVLSVYWTRSATGVKLKIDEDPKFGCPQVAYFAFRAAADSNDIWNKQMTCSFWAGILLVRWMSQQPDAVLYHFDQPGSAFAEHVAKIKYNVQRALANTAFPCSAACMPVLALGQGHGPVAMKFDRNSVDGLVWRLREFGLPKAFIMAVLLTIWVQPEISAAVGPPEATFQWIEFFAGQAQATRMMKFAGMRTARLDLLYMEAKNNRPNPMDLNSPPGMALGIMAVLRGDNVEGFLTHAGLKCSSWVPVNRGTSSRAACCSIGDMSQPSVVSSNCMISRTILLLALAVCLNATFLLEQPHNSVVDFYPRWRWFHVQLERIGGAGTVQKVFWWMIHYGSPTPKRLFGLSNSPHCHRLSMGKLIGWRQEAKKNPDRKKTCDHYIDGKGRRRYKGNKTLKESEHYPPKFGLRLVDLYNDMVANKKGCPPLPPVVPPAEATFASMSFDEDPWAEANLPEVCRYLRGSKMLQIPETFRHLLPNRL